jgi:type IV pilus assembly protein PilO
MVGFSESMESLKGFDINDLDFNNAGSWPAPIRIIVFVLVFSLIVFGGYWVFVKDQYVALDRIAAEEKKLKEEYESKAFKVSNLDAYRQQMEEIETSFGTMLKQLPQDTEVPGLLEDITGTALGSGLEIRSIALRPEATREFYVELPIAIQVVGNYHDLASFVSGVASLPRIVTLHDFTLTPVKGKGAGVLQMDISAKTYRYSAKADAKKAPAKKAKKGRK